MTITREDDVIDRYLEFVEVAMHQYIYSQYLYPKSVWETRRKYHVPVKMSRWPALNVYIYESINSLRPWIKLGRVDNFSIVVFHQKQADGGSGDDGPCLIPLSQCVFELNIFSQAMIKPNESSNWTQWEEEFSTFLLKLMIEKEMTEGAPASELTFRILVYTKNDETGSLSNVVANEKHINLSWIKAQDEVRKQESFIADIRPIHSLKSSLFGMQVFIKNYEYPSSALHMDLSS